MAFLPRPVHERLLDWLKASPRLFAYAKDDRPWGGTNPPGVAYVYAPDRKAVA